MIRSLALACALLLPAAAHAADGDAKVIATPDITYPAHEFRGIFCTSPQAAVAFEHGARSLQSEEDVAGFTVRFNKGRADICGIDTIVTFEMPQVVKMYKSEGGRQYYIYQFNTDATPYLYSWVHTPYPSEPRYRI